MAGEAEAIRYLIEERGISLETIKLLRFGWLKGCIVIPKPFDNPQHFKHLPFPRPSRSSGDLRFWHTKGADSSILFPTRDLGSAGTRVLVVESELDAAFAISANQPAVATGGTSHFSHAALKALLRRGYTLMLMPDFDRSGRQALAKVEKQLRAAGEAYEVVELAPPKGCKDLGEVVKELGREDAIEYLREACSRTTKYEQLPGDGEVWHALDTFTSKDGEAVVKKTLRNLEVMLTTDRRFKGSLWCNEMGKVRMMHHAPLQDDDLTAIRIHLEADYGINWAREDVADMVRLICSRNGVHPVRRYLDTLTWDGRPRVSALSEVIAMGKEQNLPLKLTYLRKWLIGCVARAYQPGCKMDTMLVLVSEKQGVGKSSFVAALGGDWFTDESLRPDDKDCKFTVHRKWIIELSEFDATTKKRDLAELRAFISRREDILRMPYGRIEETYPRGFVFIGTTNDLGVIKEEDGRRYWPIEVKEIDVPAVLAMRDQLWAEAVHYYRQGEVWWLEPGQETERREDSKEHFTDEDTAVVCIKNWADGPNWTKRIGIALEDAIAKWKELGIQVSRREAASVLRKAGLKPTQLWLPVDRPRSEQRNAKRWCSAEDLLSQM